MSDGWLDVTLACQFYPDPIYHLFIAAGLAGRDQDHNLEKEFNSVVNTGYEPNA